MKTIGIIGAGQLGQMLGFAGRELNLNFVFLDPANSPPAAAVGQVLNRPFDSVEGLLELAELSDVVTYEFENVSVDAIKQVASETKVYPSANALHHAQDRLVEKQLFESLKIPLAAYRTVDSAQDLQTAAEQIGLPLVLKTRRLGYDGKGQMVVSADTDIASAVTSLGGKNLIAEQWIAFDREVSAIGARNVRGDTVLYPLTENNHEGGILRTSRAPYESDNLLAQAEDYLRRLLSHLDYVGVLALELFVVDRQLLANEFAPRVHNSGHWTIEGAETSQFENHLRAILDLPLGEVSPRGHAGMLNLIGSMPENAANLTSANCYLHDYGKKPRPDRKLGHITVIADTPAARNQDIMRVRDLLTD